MCVKLLPKDLNPDPSPPNTLNTYTCGVTIVLRMCSGLICLSLKPKNELKFKFKWWEVEFYMQNETENLNYLICLCLKPKNETEI